MADGDEHTIVTQVPDLGQITQEATRHAYVIVLAGPNVGAIYRLSASDTVIGRSETCGIRLNDDGISRQHAKLTRSGTSEILLQDMQSTNGTFVDGMRVGNTVLKDGDRFQLGRTTLLKFSLSDEVEEAFQRRLYESSVRDGLTSIYNRKHFDERLEAEFSFALRHGTSLSVIMLDLDHFKQVNDTHGHQAGDEVLRSVAAALQRAVRAEDIVARFGGEEFAILARGISDRNAVMLAERIRLLVERIAVRVQDKVIKITVSAGVATFNPEPCPDSATLVATADRALYKAKAMGRNKVAAA